MRVHLVRHAKAKNRTEWAEPDDGANDPIGTDTYAGEPPLIGEPVAGRGGAGRPGAGTSRDDRARGRERRCGQPLAAVHP